MDEEDASTADESSEILEGPTDPSGRNPWHSAGEGTAPATPYGVGPQPVPAPLVPAVSPTPALPFPSQPLGIAYAPAAPVPGDLSVDPLPRRTRHRPLVWQVGLGVVGVGIVTALVIFGLNQRSSAGHWRTSSQHQESRADGLSAQLATKTQQLSASQQKVSQLNDSLATLASEKAQVTDEREQLRQIVSTVPAVTGGLRQCASSALTVAEDALDFVSEFPYGTSSAISTDSDTVTSVCGSASSAANTLDGLVDGITG